MEFQNAKELVQKAKELRKNAKELVQNTKERGQYGKEPRKKRLMNSDFDSKNDDELFNSVIFKTNANY